MRTEDGYIIQQCLDGDSAAFGLLVDKYKKSIYALAYSKVNDYHDAQDITQEVFIKAYRKLNTLRRWDNFMGWLYRITINHCKNWLRSKSNRPDSESIEDQEPGAIKALSLDSYRENISHEIVRESLKSLPEIYRQVVTLRYFGGMTIKEMAKFIGVSSNTIDRRLSGAKAQLKEEIPPMMNTEYKQNELAASFVFRVVETIRRIKIHSIPRSTELPWGISLAAGLLIAIISFGFSQDLSEPMNIGASSSFLVKANALKTGEIPVDILKSPEIYSYIANAEHDSEEDGALSTLDQVLEKYIQAVGGREAIKKLKTRSAKGHFINDIHWENPPYEEIPLEAYSKTPGKLVITEHKDAGLFQAGCDGKTTWSQDSNGVKKTDGLNHSIINWLLDPQNALRMREHFPDLTFRGRDILDGREVYVVEPTEFDKAYYTAYFDAETGLLTKMGHFCEMQDYRKVDDVKFPFRVAYSRKGGSSTFVFDEIKHNVPIDDMIFAAPKSGVVSVGDDQKEYALYPEKLEELPDIPSPYTTKFGMEVVTAFTKDQKYVLLPVTVQNGEAWKYVDGKYGKGRQLDIDKEDFPTLAKTGLHSEAELDKIESITGKSILEITDIGRPGKASRAGFMAEDEDIISVLKGDNRNVEKLGLTHPQLARLLFHIWNMKLAGVEFGDWLVWQNTEYILYNGKKINFRKMGGGKGSQDSIFNDEISGAFWIEFSRDMTQNEKIFLKEKYPSLSEEQFSVLLKKLSIVSIGEMVAYYIMRYGFYEGHTEYRTEPIAISFVFGLKSIEEIESAFQGNLYNILTEHFTE